MALGVAPPAWMGPKNLAASPYLDSNAPTPNRRSHARAQGDNHVSRSGRSRTGFCSSSLSTLLLSTLGVSWRFVALHALSSCVAVACAAAVATVSATSDERFLGVCVTLRFTSVSWRFVALHAFRGSDGRARTSGLRAARAAPGACPSSRSDDH